MASFADIPIVKDTWVNITLAVSQSPGDNLQVQNNSEARIRIEASILEPTSNKKGLIVPPYDVVTALTDVTENVWAFSEDTNAVVGVQVAS